MSAISYTRVKAHLAQTKDEVTNNRALVLLTRQKGELVVVVSLAD